MTVGPSFKILGQATATLDIDVDTKVDLSYTVTGAKLFFPPSPDNPSGGSFSPGTARASPPKTYMCHLLIYMLHSPAALC